MIKIEVPRFSEYSTWAESKYGFKSRLEKDAEGRWVEHENFDALQTMFIEFIQELASNKDDYEKLKKLINYQENKLNGVVSL
jgi:hypothetical protein